MLGRYLMSDAVTFHPPPNHGHANCVIGLGRNPINPKPSKAVLALSSETHVSPN
jgi:hypothetical protein